MARGESSPDRRHVAPTRLGRSLPPSRLRGQLCCVRPREQQMGLRQRLGEQVGGVAVTHHLPQRPRLRGTEAPSAGRLRGHGEPRGSAL